MTTGMTAGDAIKRILLAVKDRDYFRWGGPARRPAGHWPRARVQLVGGSASLCVAVRRAGRPARSACACAWAPVS